SSAKHHFEASQLGVSTRMTAWQRDSSSCSRFSQFSPAPMPLSLSKSRKRRSKPSFASAVLMSSDAFWSRLEWLMKMAGIRSRQCVPVTSRPSVANGHDHGRTFQQLYGKKRHHRIDLSRLAKTCSAL